MNFKPEDYPHKCNACGHPSYQGGGRHKCTNLDCENRDPVLTANLHPAQDSLRVDGPGFSVRHGWIDTGYVDLSGSVLNSEAGKAFYGSIVNDEIVPGAGDTGKLLYADLVGVLQEPPLVPDNLAWSAAAECWARVLQDGKGKDYVCCACMHPRLQGEACAHCRKTDGWASGKTFAALLLDTEAYRDGVGGDAAEPALVDQLMEHMDEVDKKCVLGGCALEAGQLLFNTLFPILREIRELRQNRG